MDSAREDVPAPGQLGEHVGIDPAFLCQVKTEAPEDRELGDDRDEYGAVYQVVREGADSAFRALALRLFRDEQHHPSVRGAVVNHVVNNWLSTYAQLTGFADPDAYRWHVGQDGAPGGAVEVRAAGEAFFRTVAVVQDGVLELASLSSTDHDPIVLRRTGAPPAEHYDACITLPPAGWKGGPAELSGLGWPTRATTEGFAGVVGPFQEEFQAEVKMQEGMEMEDGTSLADPLADTAGHCAGSEASLQGRETWEVWIKEEVHDTSEQAEFPQEWELATEGGETAGALHQPAASLEGGSYDGDFDSQDGLVETTETLWIKNEEAELSDTTSQEQEWLSERRDKASSDSGSSPTPVRDSRPRRVKHVPALMRRGRGTRSVEDLEERAMLEREHMRRLRRDQRRRREQTETPEEREARLRKEREAKRRLRQGAETPAQREARLAREREAKRRLRQGGETPEQREVRLAKEREEQRGVGEWRDYRELETPDEREARLKKWREDKRRQRQSETPEQREARLSKEREAKRRLRYGGETPEEREARMRREREARWPRAEGETPEQYEARLRGNLEYLEELFRGETSEQREEMLRKMREEKRRQRENETPEQHEARLEKRREERRQRIARETPEERLERIKKERAWKGVPRKPVPRVETPERREERLARFREYQKRRLHAETAEQRAARLARMREYARARLLREKGVGLEPTAAAPAEHPFAAEAFLGGAQQEQAPLSSGEQQPVGISALPGGGEQ
ncbi:hypothetical protein FOCC_FOCC011492 [Frankliniella occidentalis]|uniref:Trichohyalin-like n=1 Tax=Frankliniella occidentalis TaxID=133901 RepID=A0A6J1SJL7_FRAOC|nr:trichohyalin-like [Frankliniella occidentalis]KAE8742874.1 hypothetical protein FOCC_FOCC011492 [Frankliniella occidentalis]